MIVGAATVITPDARDRKAPGVAVIALGGTRRPGARNFPGRRSGLSGTDTFQLDRELGVCPRTGPPPDNAGASGLAL